MLNKNTKSRKFKLLSIALAIIFLVASTAYFYKIHTQASKTTGSPVAEKPGINYGPPTKEEKQAGNNAKERVIKREAQQGANQNQSGLQSVTPVITYASKTEVNAYIPGIFENDGECIATFTQGNTILTRSSRGFANVSNTQCAPISPSLPDNNSWAVVVSYKSATSSGNSTSTEVKQ